MKISMYTTLMIKQLVNFLFTIKLTVDISQGSDVPANYKNIILKIFVLSVTIARMGTIFHIKREITPAKKMYNLRIKSAMCKRRNKI